MSAVMKMKQLELNFEKRGVIIFGKKNKCDEINHSIEANNYLTINGLKVQVKKQDNYLGDYLHCEGLAKSVEASVAKHYGVCRNRVL